MISDVLSEAVDAIKEYQEEFPDTYGNLKDRIDAVTKAMEELKTYLDTPSDRRTSKPARQAWLPKVIVERGPKSERSRLAANDPKRTKRD